MVHHVLIAGNVQVLENKINILKVPMKIKSIYGLYWQMHDQYTICSGSTCKVKETFTFAGVGWGGSVSQQLMFNIFQKKGNAVMWGLAVCLIGGICLPSHLINQHLFIS